MSAGYVVGETWSIVSVWIRRYGQVVAVLLLIVVLVQVIWFLLGVNKARRKSVDE